MIRESKLTEWGDLMAIYIKGMEMPKDCQYCPCCKWKHNGDGILGCLAKNNYFTEMELCHEGKPSWCPLTEIPEPHGRLIDADEVGWAKYNPDAGYLTQYQQGWNDGVDRTLREIDGTPTIIEGSE